MCVTGFCRMIQKSWWALRNKQAKERSLSFAPAHEYKIGAVTHKVGKKRSLKKIHLFNLHSRLRTLISLSLIFIYITSSHLEHPDDSSSNTLSYKSVLSKNECTSPHLAWTPTIPSLRNITSARRKLSTALLLPNVMWQINFSLCVSSSAFHSSLCAPSAAFLSQQKGRIPLRAAILHTKYTWDAKGPSSAEITCGCIILWS